jgi:hypothetical protein
MKFIAATKDASMDVSNKRICKDDNHDFEENYYGYQCKNCDLFYAFGNAPWDDQEPNPEDYCRNCGKEFSDFGDIGCEHCDTRAVGYGVL